MAFDPIAIVGQGCVLPGAFSPDALWQLVQGQQCAITQATQADFALTRALDAAPPYASGFIRGFDQVFDPAPFKPLGLDLVALGPPCTWPLQAAHTAWQDANLKGLRPDRIGVITGNLGYPSQLKSAYAADLWRHGTSRQSPLCGLTASYPTHLIAQHINATGPVISLDAACASSLYALEIACRKLQSRHIDVALVGAINTADNLTLHIGFDALQALSPSRQSRPFHRDADGLVPSEGAAALVLKRQSDIGPDDTVHGIIRAIGLSNDGNRKGLLAPSAPGQIEAIHRAWQEADLAPNTLDLLECHATGTPTGDTVELEAAQQYFAGHDTLPIGSLKANLGHLITVAGLASILKITQAMAHGTLPATPHSGHQNRALDGSNLLIQSQDAPWQRSTSPRRAAISNFGFGGNNAHLILDQYDPPRQLVPVKSLPADDDIVIINVALMAGQAHTTQDVLEHLAQTPQKPFAAMTGIGADPLAARTPPTDLRAAEPQYLALLQTVQSALSGLDLDDRDQTGIFTNTNTSFDFCRFLVRERAEDTDRNAICEPLAAKHVLGAMANMSANRINFANNIRGRGFAVLSDGLDRIATLDAAFTALHSRQLTVAIVASAHLPDDMLTRLTNATTGLADEHIGHAACLVLMRKADAVAQKHTILGTLSDLTSRAPSRPVLPDPQDLIFRIGAASLLTRHKDPTAAKTTTFQSPKTLAANGGQITLTPTRSGTLPPPRHTPNPSVHRSIAYPLPQFSDTDPHAMTSTSPQPPITLPLAPPRPYPHYPSTHTAPQKRFQPEPVRDGNTQLSRRPPVGPSWKRAEIERASTGPISELFGPVFTQQDEYDRVVRLPASPLLFVDGILGIDAEAGVESSGTIWTRTELSDHSWTHHAGHIRPGPLIECGQADLSLISYMGADFRNKNTRVYRLLGCDITFHETGLPYAEGELTFQIEIVGHARLGETRLFFFQYDAYKDDQLVFSVRNGQAGFFTTHELVTASGMNWDAGTLEPPTPNAEYIIPPHTSRKTHFSASEVNTFREGDPFACFGEGFERTAAHSRTPHLPSGRLALFDHVETFNPSGGPWKRGYLKAIADMPRDHWLYQGHFHNDPCMPGTMMAEAAVQALEFHAAALGLTIDRDGYIFEPLPDHTAQFICRGQVTPDKDHTLTYEVFIDKIITGDTIEVHAALLASCDGRKVFLCPHFAIRLRRVWPQPNRLTLPSLIGPTKQSRGDYSALLACANGAPSEAFGNMYAPFDHIGNVPRLPQPPYHMMTRITQVSTDPGDPSIGANLVSEYEIQPDAWFFDCNEGVMPLSVLTEIALQPCGWLASHCGFALESGSAFRNLEGDGDIHRSLRPEDGTLTITSRLTSVSKVGPMTIVGFELSVTLAKGEAVMTLKTQFGFFPPDALARQSGLPRTEAGTAAFQHNRNTSALLPYSPTTRIGRLRMLDEIDYFDPAGGRAGLGLIRARQTVDPYAWYFKAHFFQDPVQPGSLGLDALVQALCCLANLKQITPEGRKLPIETPAANAPVRWSYRGQVTPESKSVVALVEITDITTRNGRTHITACGSLWCDGVRIYEMQTVSIAL